MYMPSLFSDLFFDDFMDDFAPRAERRPRPVPAMRTDVKELGDSYQLDIELPGYSKDQVSAQLKDGYMTILAQKTGENEEKSEGRFIRRERFTGSVKRSFYVGKNLTEEDIRARFEDGILKITLPKEAPKKVEEQKFIAIEG